MVRIVFIAALLFTYSISNTSAQIKEFKEWLKSPKGDIATQPFAKKSLNKEECAQATAIIDSLWVESTAKRLHQEWSKMTLNNDSIKLACAVRTFGKTPQDGRSLYISMHGGGECPKEVNDEQWMNQIYLYEPKEGVYVAPRAPWNTWDLWHRKGLDELLEKLIQACVVFENVNPDKVYIMGYSAGGDGTWRLAPRMADKWAAASMMAGHPGGTSQINLYNLPFMIWMGEEDHAYERSRLAKEKGAIMDSLQALNPDAYIHQTNIIKGNGHWMNRADTASLGWMSQYRRNPYPKRVVWRQELVTREHFYWLSAPKNQLHHGLTIIANIEGNTINIERCDYSNLTIHLNDSMVDLDKKVTILYKGKKIAKKKPKRNISNLYNSIEARKDKRYIFPYSIKVDL